MMGHYLIEENKCNNINLVIIVYRKHQGRRQGVIFGGHLYITLFKRSATFSWREVEKKIDKQYL